jgi:hypothetical protein
VGLARLSDGRIHSGIGAFNRLVTGSGDTAFCAPPAAAKSPK